MTTTNSCNKSRRSCWKIVGSSFGRLSVEGARRQSPPILIDCFRWRHSIFRLFTTRRTNGYYPFDYGRVTFSLAMETTFTIVKTEDAISDSRRYNTSCIQVSILIGRVTCVYSYGSDAFFHSFISTCSIHQSVHLMSKISVDCNAPPRPFTIDDGMGWGRDDVRADRHTRVSVCLCVSGLNIKKVGASRLDRKPACDDETIWPSAGQTTVWPTNTHTTAPYQVQCSVR